MFGNCLILRSNFEHWISQKQSEKKKRIKIQFLFIPIRNKIRVKNTKSVLLRPTIFETPQSNWDYCLILLTEAGAYPQHPTQPIFFFDHFQTYTAI